MSARSIRLGALAALPVLLGGAAGVVFGSAATLTVTPKNASAFRACVLTGYPTNSVALIDTWADENSPTSKKGSGLTLQVQSESGGNNRVYIRFDLTKCAPVIASGATVKKATLRVNLSSAPNASRTYNIHRITGPCPEAATTCWSEGGLTWNNKPTVATSATSALALTSSSATNQYYAFDVTADAAAMVADTASNFGWRISDSVEGAGTSRIAIFKSKNALLNAAGAPQLVVVYTP